jgi:hypothetical protein
MKASVILALFASTGMATVYDGRNNLCPTGLTYGSITCCSTNVLGLLSLDCESPKNYPRNGRDFRVQCGSRSAMCCTLEAADQGVLCKKAIGA